ncbi:MAG: prepilin-type N-terminal cleavage/methylation domain-containing protein [Rhodospirillales bacterium]|nr:prepilin-type N-terminal cleavage/methylation domain-containing protein [Alphaproteobacteria bacterium]USO06433.1 MAG: prepilin-type N-terminal cleavage/methylation domain-containing protein [Rhodospirillales bacterium]
MNTTLQTMRKDEQGFTLVELAVVMIIIGLLIGGILKGQELITNARVTSTASQMESLGAAYNTFRDQFNAIPGDMGSATARLANCPNTSACGIDISATANNGIIDENVGEAPADEGIAFFGQMLAAGLITGMDGSGQTAAMGVTNPTASIGGGFMVGDTRTGTLNGFDGTEFRAGIYLVLNGVAATVDGSNGAVTGVQAANIDRRLDDGNALTGSIISDNGQNCRGTTQDNNGNDVAGTSYDLTSVDSICALAYRM